MAPRRRPDAGTPKSQEKSPAAAAVAGARKNPLHAARQQEAIRAQRVKLVSALGVLFGVFVVWRVARWQRTPTAYAAILEVPRLDGTSPEAVRIFFERFYNQKPVVIEGVLDTWPAMQWSPFSLADRCPQAQLPVYRYNLDAGETGDWAALEDAGEPLLADYLRSEFGRKNDSEPHEARYGLEMALRNNCPELLEDIRIPAFFVDDMLVHHYKKVAWPTLIVGPRGTRSGLHRDTHNLPFWMALFVGRKRWRIFDPEEPAVEPYFHVKKNSFAFDAFAPDFAAFPKLGRAKVYEHLLEAGQVMYIPSGAPHAAFNEEDTVAISGNYLDGRGLERHLNKTCQQPFWRESKLCWFHTSDFARHKPAAWEALHERSYFEFVGFQGPADWCKAFVPELKERADINAELTRCVPIVEAYCASKA